MTVSLFIPNDIYAGNLLQCLEHAFSDGNIRAIMPPESLLEYASTIPSSQTAYAMLFVDMDHKEDEWNSSILENFIDIEKIPLPSKKFYKKGVIVHGDTSDPIIFRTGEIIAYIKGYLNVGKREKV